MPIHPLAVRITHWTNAVAMTVMIASGWQIYNAAPVFPFVFPTWLTLGGWLGGALAWHDFGRLGVNGVRKYLIELAASGLKINVVPGGSLAYAVDVNSSRLAAVP